MPHITTNDLMRPDPSLLLKYSISGPRYTSYPTATRFTEKFDRLQAEAAIADDNVRGGPLSLYFHLPFCESQCWFCGCNTVINRRRESAAEYLGVLEHEVDITAARLAADRPVIQVHLGGGSPTFLSPGQLHRLGAIVRRHFQLHPACEFGVEVDPRRLTREHVCALREIGANRASIGVQDTNPRVQIAIHRIQPHEDNIQAVAWLRAQGFSSINVDLVYGLPLQTPSSFAQTVDDVLRLDPDRISLFGYAHVPWIKPAQKVFDQRGQLPGTEERLAMFVTAHEQLTNAGFIDIGLDHFARPTDALARAQRDGTLQRNFQGYSTHAGASLYGFGISAISATSATYRQNHKTLAGWMDDVDVGLLPVERGIRLSDDDVHRRAVIMRLMCDRRLDYAAISRELEINFPAKFAAELASLDDLVADNIVTRSDRELTITPLGVPLLRVVAMRFDSGSRGAVRHAATI